MTYKEKPRQAICSVGSLPLQTGPVPSGGRCGTQEAPCPGATPKLGKFPGSQRKGDPWLDPGTFANLPWWLSGKESCSAGDRGLNPGSGRSPGGGNGNPFQYSCLESLMDGGAWVAAVHGVAKSWARLSE